MLVWLMLTLQTNIPGYSSPECVVERRYNDFVWLREQLAATMRNHVVPPLPEKTGVTASTHHQNATFITLLDRFSPELLEYRRRELDKFLTRIAQVRRFRVAYR